VQAQTEVLWLIGRTQTNGPADYAAVHEFQNALTIESVGAGALSTTVRPSVAPPGLDLTREPLSLVNDLSAVDFFAYATRLLAQHPAHPTDFSILARIAELGMIAGTEFDAGGYDDRRLDALQERRDGRARAPPRDAPDACPGGKWMVDEHRHHGCVRQLLREARHRHDGGTRCEPGRRRDLPLAVADVAGEKIVGEKNYVQRFGADDLPPVDAFWSVTMYDDDSFQAANDLNRFALGDRDPLHYNADGSLDMYYGPTDPGASSPRIGFPRRPARCGSSCGCTHRVPKPSTGTEPARGRCPRDSLRRAEPTGRLECGHTHPLAVSNPRGSGARRSPRAPSTGGGTGR
jgi:hypothetical protein